jgi:hypothetical protein
MSDKKFWDTDTGKVFAHGLHEHNSAIGLIKGKIYLYKKGAYKISDIPKLVEQLEGNVKKAQDAMDFIYKNIRELQGF